MEKVTLFFGFPLSEKYIEVLTTVDPRLYHLYVGDSSSSLQELSYKGVRYLGKPLETVVDSGTLELLQLNIYSLLTKLVPTFPYHETPLCLVPCLH